MARRNTTTGDQLSPEEIAYLKAQTERLGAETNLTRQELQQKSDLARLQMALDQTLGQGKLDLGKSEISSKDRLGNLSAAMEALGLNQKGEQLHEANQSNILSDVIKRPEITTDMIGDLLKAGGSPLADAFSAKQARDRETAIQGVLPAIKGAKSDKVRETAIKPALAKYPGAYEEALARAFPKPGQTPAPAPTTTAPAQTVKESAGATSPLVNRLLQLAGVNEGGQGGASAPDTGGIPANYSGAYAGLVNPYPQLPNTPETAYTGVGHGALEGTRRTDVGGETQLSLPSGGFASVNTPATDTGNARLNALIEPRRAAPSIATTEQAPQFNATEPGALQGRGAGSTWDQLIAQPSAAPTPTPAQSPIVAAAPVTNVNPAATPAPTPAEILLELARRQQQQNQTY